MFLLPALVLYIVFVILPVCGTVALSFTHWRFVSLSTIKYIGLTNYVNLRSDPVFWKALVNTFVFTGFSVNAQVAIGLTLALLLEQKIIFVRWFRGAYLLPATVSLVVVAIMADLILNPALGVLKGLLEPVGLQKLSRFGLWFASERKALWALSLVQVWYGFGFSMFIIISGLKSINPQLFEAAEMDGASELKKIIHVTLPLLKPSISVAFLLATMRAIRVYALPYVMTRTGPGHATETLSTWAYYQGFDYRRMGYGSAVAIALLILGVTLSFLIFKFTPLGRRE